ATRYRVSGEIEPIDWDIKPLHHPGVVEAGHELARHDVAVHANPVPLGRNTRRAIGIDVIGRKLNAHFIGHQTISLELRQIAQDATDWKRNDERTPTAKRAASV